MHTTNDLETSNPSIAVRRSVILKELDIDVDMSSLSNQAVIAVFNETCVNLGYSLRGRDGVTDQLIERAHGGKGFVFVEIPNKVNLAELKEKLTFNLQEAVQRKENRAAAKAQAIVAKNEPSVNNGKNDGEQAELLAAINLAEKNHIVCIEGKTIMRYNHTQGDYLYSFDSDSNDSFPTGLPTAELLLSDFNHYDSNESRGNAIADVLGIGKANRDSKNDYAIFTLNGTLKNSAKLDGKHSPTAVNAANATGGWIYIRPTDENYVEAKKAIIAYQENPKESPLTRPDLFAMVTKGNYSITFSELSAAFRNILGEHADAMFQEALLGAVSKGRYYLGQKNPQAWSQAVIKCMSKENLSGPVALSDIAEYIHILNKNGDIINVMRIADCVNNNLNRFYIDTAGSGKNGHYSLDEDGVIGIYVKLQIRLDTKGLPVKTTLSPCLKTYTWAVGELAERFDDAKKKEICVAGIIQTPIPMSGTDSIFADNKTIYSNPAVFVQHEFA